ncbi:MAG: 30S ribosomal protein S21 [bacterium]
MKVTNKKGRCHLMVDVKRKDGESFDSFMRRFTKTLQRSGKLLEAKKKRFHRRPLSELKVKQSAQHREHIKSKIEYLKKIGKYDDLMDPATRKKVLRG